MLIRALIVLLVFLNLGVAGWWVTRTPPAPPVAEMRQAAPLLELTQVTPKPAPAIVPAAPVEMTPGAIEPAIQAPVPSTPPAASAETVAASSPPAPAPAPAPTAPVSTKVQCVALGPFDDQAAARAARGRLQPAPRAASLRSETPPAKAYSVLLPPLADRAAAQAMTERIAAAGFNDFMIINAGESANGVALGRYGSLESAERRQAQLKAGGFPAQIQPAGQTGATRWWLDVTLASDVQAARAQAQATRALPRDCG